MRQARYSFMFATMLTGAAHAQPEYSPPPIGTMITWSFGSEEGRETRLSEVVATGPDYAIFLADLRLSEDSPAAYFAEFSGIHIASCAAKMPSADEREQLSAAWPLTSGEKLTVEGDLEATYTIGKLVSHTLNLIEGPTQARQIKVNYGGIENDITLSMDWNMAVEVKWPDGTGDKALEVVPPGKERDLRGDLPDMIGNCASLLAN